MDANYNSNRDKAIKWLNGKRDFMQGIEIIRSTGFKPTVVRVLARQGSQAPSAMERLVSLFRDYIKVWAGKVSTDDTDTTLGVIDGKEIGSAQDCTDEPSIFKAYEHADDFPAGIAEAIRRYRESYILRDKLMRQLADVGESNDEESISLRKTISDAIKAQSDLQDKLYPIYAKYLETGEITYVDEPSVEDVQPRKNIEKDTGELSELDKSQLQKLRKSLSTKIIRAKNMLIYQQETRADKENPIPEGDVRREKYISKINRLQNKVKEIDFAIAKLA